jgi:hypothetical protein
MTLALALFVLIAAILLAQGYALKSLPSPAAACCSILLTKRHRLGRWELRHIHFLIAGRHC